MKFSYAVFCKNRVEEAKEVITKEVTEEVEQQLTKLMEILLDEGRLEDLKRITKEKEYREELYRAYHIK